MKTLRTIWQWIIIILSLIPAAIFLFGIGIWYLTKFGAYIPLLGNGRGMEEEINL